jgi:hypothetical protein
MVLNSNRAVIDGCGYWRLLAGGGVRGGRLDACDPVWQAYGAATGTVVASVAL